MANDSTRRCYKCRQPEVITKTGEHELRPYGIGGALVCFNCAMTDLATTEAECAKRMDEAAAQSPSGAVLLTEDEGFVPLSIAKPS